MATDLEARARDAFVDDNLELAVDLYTQALDMDPKNANLYTDRAQANIKLENFTEAVADANKAIELDPSIVKAYLRKGIACVKLEEYQTAKTCLEAGACLAPGDSRFTQLIKECDERIAEETIDLPKKVMLNVPPSTVSSSSNISTEIAKDSQSSKNAPSQTTAMPNKLKYRHDYYNSSTEVVLTIFAKGIPAKNVYVEFGEQMLSVIIDIPGEEKYQFQPRLFGKIIPKNCRYKVMYSKIEIRLSKAEPITWTSLEFSDKRTVPQKINVLSAPVSHRPSYPSSKAKVDWDKLEALVEKEEEEEKLGGDAALNKLFQEIYRDADEDTRRAMSKSFIESNGTVLSTNWKDVGSKKVGENPPQGMELKKWEY